MANIFKGENSEYIPLNSGTRQDVGSTYIQYYSESPSKCKNARKRNKGIQITKKDIKCSLFSR